MVELILIVGPIVCGVLGTTGYAIINKKNKGKRDVFRGPYWDITRELVQYKKTQQHMNEATKGWSK